MHSIRRKIADWLETAKVRNAILTVILLNAGLLGLETSCPETRLTSSRWENPSAVVWPHAASFSSAIFVANSQGVRLLRDEWDLFRL